MAKITLDLLHAWLEDSGTRLHTTIIYGWLSARLRTHGDADSLGGK